MDRLDVAKLFDGVRNQIRDEIVGLILKQPFWQQRFGYKISERLTVDMDSSLVALSKSIRYGSPMLFADHIRWQRDQFQAIGCSTGHFREICTYIWTVANACFPNHTLSSISVPVQSALDGLSYTGTAQAMAGLHAELAEALVAATVDTHWHWQAIYGAGGRDRALYDAWFFIDYVIDALGSGKPGTLRQELLRMRQDVMVRGLCTLHVRQLAWLLDQAAAAQLPAEAAAELRAMLELVLPALDDTADGCLALMGVQEQIVNEVAAQLTTAGLSPHSDQTHAEIGWYLAYLTDSIAAGNPGPMLSYTRWMQQWLSSQGLPDTPLRHSYEALYAAVSRHLPEYASRDALAILQAARRLF